MAIEEGGMSTSRLESKFSLYWRGLQGPPLTPEHKFHPKRKWRFDFASVETKTAIEIEGGVWTGGRHTRGSGYVSDCEKYNEATKEGWAVFRLTSGSITTPELLSIALFIRNRTKELNK
jgi:very-short-patch-repair endonuclease